jgi:hypothetical protein
MKAILMATSFRETGTQQIGTARRVLRFFGKDRHRPSRRAGPTIYERASRIRFLSWQAGLLAALALVFPLAMQAANTESVGKRFATPEEAVASLRSATAAADTNALRIILGPAAQDLQNPDRIQATNELKSFSSALAQTNHLLHLSGTRVILELGDDLWPFPVPIVKQDGGWFFDTAAGKDELLSRRIGTNELGTLEAVRGYVDAQREYASADHDGDEVLEYAQRLVSSPGKHDGLYWPPEFEGGLSPLGPLVAFAEPEGYSPELREEEEVERGPFHGYYFRILTRQGKHAPGGKHDYVINGNMIGGFAMIAWPARYGESGIMTFIVNQQGRVYQKDLGPKTSKIVGKMKAYDPDSSWTLSPD